MSKESRDFDLEERLIDFAVRVIRIAESLPKSRVGNHIAGQLKENFIIRNSLFVIQYSFFSVKQGSFLN
jgi:hypothetical protein